MAQEMHQRHTMHTSAHGVRTAHRAEPDQIWFKTVCMNPAPVNHRRLADGFTCSAVFPVMFQLR